MSIIYKNAKTRRIQIFLDWGSIPHEIVCAGTPISAAGQIANNSDAIGILPYTVGRRGQSNDAVDLIVSGMLYLPEVEEESGLTISESCFAALDEISFVRADGTLVQANVNLNDLLAPEYSASSTYAAGSYVTHEGKLYTNANAISTPEAWTAAHWTEVTVGNQLSGLKTADAGLSSNIAALSGKVGVLTDLTTTDKSNLVAAVNEVKSLALAAATSEGHLVDARDSGQYLMSWGVNASGYPTLTLTAE